MRITFPVASNGEAWYPQIPYVDLAACYPQPDAFDEAAFRAQVKDRRRVQFAPEDSGCVVAFGANLLDRLAAWLGTNRREESEATDKIRARINRRMKRNVFSFVRADLTQKVFRSGNSVYAGVRVKITYDQNGVVENHPFEQWFAMVVADFCKGILDARMDRGDPEFVFFSDETKALLFDLHVMTEEADAKDARAKKIGERFWCSHHRSGYCVADKDGNPPCFDCICYLKGSGKCVNPDEKGGEKNG